MRPQEVRTFETDVRDAASHNFITSGQIFGYTADKSLSGDSSWRVN